MGALSDFFGGSAKVRDLPPELRQLARNSTDASQMLYDQHREAVRRSQPWIDRMENYAGQAIGDLDPARNFAQRLGEESMRDYDRYLRPIANKTYGEIAGAGSDGRIAQRGSEARADYMAATEASLRQQERMAGRMGLRGANSPFNAQTAITRAAGAAAAKNAAENQERMYGEGVRRAALGSVLGERGRTLSFMGLPSGISMQQMDIAGQGGSAYGRMMGGFMPLATNATSIGQTAYDMGSKNFQHDLYRDQANANRRSNMIESGLNVSAQIAGAMMGVPPGMMPQIGTSLRGGNAGGQLGGIGLKTGQDPWGSLKNWAMSSGGGGGGATPPSGFGASGRYYPR